MSPLEQSDVDYGRSRRGINYFKKSSLQPGESVVLSIVDVEKNTTSKFPIPKETFCYRFILEDGRVWDENAATVFGALLRLCYSDGKTFTPISARLTKLAVKPLRGSQYQVGKA